ncbi:MAG: BamA/TamA family outer membrane protein, partial [Bacteroidota bacterium]
VKPAAERPNAHFDSNRFYKEFAIDAGVGIRLNFEILVVRFDFALPLHDPRFSENERWIVKDINYDWLKNNTNFNFGIGYPF